MWEKQIKYWFSTKGKGNEGLKVLCQVKPTSNSKIFEGIIDKGQGKQSYDSEL